jgi:hypothetical protein
MAATYVKNIAAGAMSPVSGGGKPPGNIQCEEGIEMKLLLAAGLLGMTLVPAQVLADSPFDGTWKADVTSANFPKKPDIYLLKDGMYDCKTCTPPYTIKADGTDQAVTGHPYYNTEAVKVVDDHTVQITDKKDGKTVTTTTVTIAADGNSGTFDFSDSSNTNAAPVTGKGTQKKIAAGPAGSHAISGSWITTSYSGSDNGLTFTYKVNGNVLTMTNPTGQSYTAKMDGTEAPYKGDPGLTTVTVKMAGARTIVETDMRNGKVIGVFRGTVSNSGDTLAASYHDSLHNRTTTWTAKKI